MKHIFLLICSTLVLSTGHALEAIEGAKKDFKEIKAKVAEKIEKVKSKKPKIKAAISETATKVNTKIQKTFNN